MAEYVCFPYVFGVGCGTHPMLRLPTPSRGWRRKLMDDAPSVRGFREVMEALEGEIPSLMTRSHQLLFLSV